VDQPDDAIIDSKGPIAIGAERVSEITFEQLRSFLWVARLGGVRRASEQMHLSQPAVSGRLRTLEEALKVQLFERTTRGVQLTRQGETLRGYAEQLFFVQEEIRKRVCNPESIEGRFRIGASETIAQAWLPNFLKRVSEEYPRLSLDLTVDVSAVLREDLLARKLDLALMMGPVSEFSIENIALPEFELSWFSAAGTGPIDFMRTPVISYSRNTRPNRQLVDELSKRYGPGVRIYTTSSLSTGLQMIAAGIGVGPYPRLLASDQLKAGKIQAFDPGWVPRPLAFTASYCAEPGNAIAEQCASLALMTAQSM
jgi:DNA-binding transcriptional LysR family regulator